MPSARDRGHETDCAVEFFLGVVVVRGEPDQFSALIAHLANVVPADYAPDVSGVSTTTLQIGGAVGVAAFGTLYLSLTSSTPSTHASHAFAVSAAAFAAVALLAAAIARRTTRRESSGAGQRRWQPAAIS